jgi:hypothetical protein
MKLGAVKPHLMVDSEILHAFGSGTTDYYRNIIVMQSAEFVVIRTPGHSDWESVGARAYYPTHTVLIRKGEWCLRGSREEWHGRVSKKILKSRLDIAQENGAVTPQIWQDKEPTRLRR